MHLSWCTLKVEIYVGNRLDLWELATILLLQLWILWIIVFLIRQNKRLELLPTAYTGNNHNHKARPHHRPQYDSNFIWRRLCTTCPTLSLILIHRYALSQWIRIILPRTGQVIPTTAAHTLRIGETLISVIIASLANWQTAWVAYTIGDGESSGVRTWLVVDLADDVTVLDQFGIQVAGAWCVACDWRAHEHEHPYNSLFHPLQRGSHLINMRNQY